MKKILVLVLVLVAFTTNLFSVNPNEYDAFSQLYSKSKFKSLVRYLEVDSVQSNQLKKVFSVSESDLGNALKSENEIAAEKAVWFSLGNAREILSDKQYNKMLSILYVTIYNKNEQFLTENK